MTHEEYVQAAEYWKKNAGVKMEPRQLKTLAEEYILANNTCALATGTGDWVRCTPIEYSYHDGAFWMFTEGGEKFIGLEKNDNVSLAIFDRYTGFGNIKGMQIQGKATVVEPFSEEYVSAAEYKKIPLEALKKLPSPMHLLKVRPVRLSFLNSDFRKNGAASRQELVF
ncbi:MAG: pyridoxamine 5'-phosphate oxidase family protein [Lachnospiraceae bacterium]|nr:pyridoxamine 5'-phosphate oxidase family protein [Lachnospiraceae bacterium]